MKSKENIPTSATKKHAEWLVENHPDFPKVVINRIRTAENGSEARQLADIYDRLSSLQRSLVPENDSSYK